MNEMTMKSFMETARCLVVESGRKYGNTEATYTLSKKCLKVWFKSMLPNVPVTEKQIEMLIRKYWEVA